MVAFPASMSMKPSLSPDPQGACHQEAGGNIPTPSAHTRTHTHTHTHSQRALSRTATQWAQITFNSRTYCQLNKDHYFRKCQYFLKKKIPLL